MSSKTGRRFGALVATTIGFLVVGSALSVAQAQQSSTPVPVSGTTAQPPVGLPDISVDVKFDKHLYHVGDAATLTVTISNKGTATANRVRVMQDNPPPPNTIVVDPAEWGDLAANGPGVDLAAGANKTVELHAVVPPEAGTDDGTFEFVRYFHHDGPGAHNGIAYVYIAVNVVKPHGSLSGVVYYDRDGDIKVDPGEAIAGVEIMLPIPGSTEPHWATAVTDENGNFQFSDLEVGCYELRLAPNSPWTLVTDRIARPACVRHTNPNYLPVRVMPRNGVPPTSTEPSTTASAPTAVETTSGVAGEAQPTITTTTTASKAANPRTLASTGADVGPFLVIGTLALAVGTGTIVLARRRKHADS